MERKYMENFKDEEFDTKIKNEPVVCVQFSASWCAPCRTLRPVEKLVLNIK